VKIVPILVGSCIPETEAMYGRLLAKYIDDPSNFFSVSSDFCHWGQRYACIVLSWAKPPNLGSCICAQITVLLKDSSMCFCGSKVICSD
jgi:predicted class III extradiol MEMO1 family dioxygenase